MQFCFVEKFNTTVGLWRQLWFLKQWISSGFDVWTAHEIQGNGASHIFAEKSAKSERHLQEASMLQVAEEHSFNEHQNTTSIDVEQQKLNLPIAPQMLLRGVANWEHIYQKTLLKTSDRKFSFDLEFHHKKPMDQNTLFYLSNCPGIWWLHPSQCRISLMSSSANRLFPGHKLK